MISINAKKIAHCLFWILACLIAINLLILLLKHYSNSDISVSVYNLFNFDREANIPSLFSVLLLLFSGFALLLNRYFENNEKLFKGWTIISALFFYLSIDEGSQTHESIMDVIKIFYTGSGVFYFVWVIPAIIAVIILFFLLYKFFSLLPNTFKKQFLTGMSIYLAGAIGMEMVGGFFVSNFGDGSIIYPLIIVVEESLEIIGSIVIFMAGVNNLKKISSDIKIKIS